MKGIVVIGVIGILLIEILLFGCTGKTDVTTIAKTLPEIQSFLKAYPNATMKIILLDEESVLQDIDSIRESCGNQIEVKSYYKITVESPEFDLVTFLEPQNQTVECSIVKTKAVDNKIITTNTTNASQDTNPITPTPSTIENISDTKNVTQTPSTVIPPTIPTDYNPSKNDTYSGSFTDNQNELCMIGGKPVIRLYSTTWCPHCAWIKSTFDKVANEYVAAGKIVAYHWEMDTKDNTLTTGVESAIPTSEMQYFNSGNPQGYVPFYSFGCKYERIGNGFERERNNEELAKEETEFRALIETMISEGNPQPIVTPPPTNPPETTETPPQAETQVPNTENSKTEKPFVKLFVMSFCPYGQQAEKGIWPVLNLLGDKINFELHFVIYPSSSYSGQENAYCMGDYCSMHGIAELNEDIRQLCIMRLYTQETGRDYIQKINLNCTSKNIDTCWKSVAQSIGLDTTNIENCYNEDKINLAAAEKQSCDTYNAQGSPTLFINDIEYQGGRTSEAYKSAICSAFISPPLECNQTLSSISNTSSAPSGGCG